jgi:hypothetical protein
MSKPVIQKKKTDTGHIILTFYGSCQKKQLRFRNEEEFQLFLDYLLVLDRLGATSLERVV